MTIKCPKCDSENTDTARFCSNCATSLQPSEDIPVQTKTIEAPKEELTTGSTFAGRYQIVEELGRGGMGRVYKAQDTEIKEKIALKLIKPEISSDKKTIERFQNELKLARKISHRNVCRMHHLEKSEGNYFITMEYVDGENLKGMIRMMGQLSSGKAISIAKQVCEGLSEAHRIGVVHRDLKPSNIMIDKEGNAKIMDFGIARSLTGKGITGVGVMIGTPEYMSPEQVESKEIDQRSDIYSLGVILYEMVTGRVPFEGDTPYSIGVKHKSELPRNPKEINPQISDDLNRMILKCLEKEKDKRYQSAGELRSELENIERGMPTTDRVIPERKPLTSKEITVTFGLKKLLVPALALIAVVTIAVVIWKPWSKKAPTPLPSDKPSLAVVYFENNTGDENLDHWRKSISNLLITDLTQSKYLKVLGGDRLFFILKQLNQLDAETYSADVLKEVASRGRVNHILRGSYSKAGDIIRINTVLQDANTGEPIATERVEGKGEESIFSLVDDLTRKVKASFKFSEEQITDDLDKQVVEITTSSPEAYKYYSEGMKYQNMGDEPKAIEFLEKAVAVDAGFASAYVSLSSSYWNIEMWSEAKKYSQKGFELRDRVSDYERYRIEADFYGYSEKTYDKAIEALHTLLELYPEDLFGGQFLGWTYAAIEEWDKAIEILKVNHRNKDESFFAYTPSSFSYRAKGLYEKAIEVLELFLNLKDSAWVQIHLAMTYLCQGKYDLALNEADKALSDPRVFLVTASIYSCRGEFLKAEKEILLYLDKADVSSKIQGLRLMGTINLSQGKFRRAEEAHKQALKLASEVLEKFQQCYSHYYLAYTYLKSGEHDRAIEEIEKARILSVDEEDLNMQRRSLFLKGLIYLEMGLLDNALQTAEELKKLIDSGMNKKAIRFYHHLMGMMMLKDENFPKAIELFNQALSFLHFQTGWYEQWVDDHALFIEPLALSYYKSGDLEKAIEEYERIISLTTGRRFSGDIYATSFYMLGKIHEQQGDTAKAIEHYEKFLDLWKDADPDIAEVDDARKRLVALK
jgi:serine/threonine protein kinase/lipopolysaccharide biosynthesis regulator YciM